MLIQFNFKNYKSFRDDATLDFSAADIPEFPNRVVEVGEEKILRAAAIYGANASGKSNVCDAFHYMSSYVAKSFQYGGEDNAQQYRATPFLFDAQSAVAESSFEVYFTLGKDEREAVYNYGFCVGDDGVSEEWLNCKEQSGQSSRQLIYRDVKRNELVLDGIPEAFHENIEISLDKQVLIISLGAKLKIDLCRIVRDWFLANKFADFGNPLTNFFLSRRIPKGFAEDIAIQEKVVHYFSAFDKGIQAFHIEKAPHDEERDDDGYTIFTLHKCIDSDETVEIPFSMESAGTLKMFALYPALQETLERGSVLVVDELNARLHPLLVRNFLLTFLDPKMNKNGAQLIFTTHDTWQLSNHLLRKDEIWFTEKDESGVTALYSLADFIDVNENTEQHYGENYLLGKYGAIPILRELKSLRRE